MRTPRLLVLGWTAAFLALIESAAMATDCNRNGVDDATDVETGASLDCNHDLIPDECDLLEVNYGLTVAETIPSPWDGNSDIALLDLEGNGALDLALADELIHRVYLFRNEGSLQFQPVTGTSGVVDVGYHTLAMITGDLNGDGHADLATLNLESDDITMLLNDGHGTFSPASNPVGRYPYSFTAADLDRDGDLDFAAVRYESSVVVEVLENDGQGSLSPKSSYPIDAPGLFSTPWLTAGDLDGDQGPDLVVIPGNGKITILWNSGAGAFPTRLATQVAGGTALVADLDADGALDLVTVQTAAPQVGLYLNPGDGRFPGAGFTAALPGYPSSPIAADLDGDGDLDFATGGSAITAFLNHGRGRFSTSAPLLGEGLIRAADLNGDGSVEFVTLGLEVLAPRAARYSPDCNSNGIPDECDIAQGTSKDCNGNKIPDECDLAAGLSQDCNANGILDICEKDCNHNGIHDDCELAAGTSTDLDADGILDECGPVFTLGFDGPEFVQGIPGDAPTFDVYPTLATTNNFTGDGAQGWSLSLFCEGGTVEAISVKGVQVSTIYDDKDGVHHDPYTFDLGDSFTRIASLSEHWQDPSLKGAISAVVMKAQERMVLQPRLTQRIARLRVKAALPANGDCGSVTLFFQNGGKSSCSCPVNNAITFQGGSKMPIEDSLAIPVCPARFRRADSNSDGAVDISDAIFTLAYLFQGGQSPDCLEANDANDDTLLDLSDPVFLLECLFLGRGLHQVPAPGAYDCGPDAAFQGLSCDRSICPPELPGGS
jgi:VCBS repeat protein